MTPEKYKWTKDKVRERLKELHAEENAFNIAISKYDKEIKQIMKHKKVVAKRISDNMRYRNRLIQQL